MSEITFIASQNSLPEIVRTGARLIKVKDASQVNDQQETETSKGLNEESELLFIDNENLFNNLSISKCSNLPNGFKKYITLEHVYIIEARLKTNFIHQTFDYILNLPKYIEIELWSIWDGYEEQPIKYRRIKRDELSYNDLEFFLDGSCCLVIEK
ncbi:hypothetical protein J40TS1_19980 [Paenibacillus montaniterrae]|uniref:Uncharacterized protein n=1 Tax=Paenibacillus montaniterrae TaxID=429341 RepID=A0A920CWY1_9BACL|nr:hypothetical protein [Paenibacillus montaniterrae]GIP16356.1 hypothetical protein J40TS1_19980 [Paenibacillus montaniterrae]